MLVFNFSTTSDHHFTPPFILSIPLSATLASTLVPLAFLPFNSPPRPSGNAALRCQFETWICSFALRCGSRICWVGKEGADNSTFQSSVVEKFGREQHTRKNLLNKNQSGFGQMYKVSEGTRHKMNLKAAQMEQGWQIWIRASRTCTKCRKEEQRDTHHPHKKSHSSMRWPLGVGRRAALDLQLAQHARNSHPTECELLPASRYQIARSQNTHFYLSLSVLQDCTEYPVTGWR